jgi:hypothetical protein
VEQRKTSSYPSVLRWAVFLFLLAIVMVWAVRGVLERAGRMKAANTSVSASTAMKPGNPARVVARLDQVVGENLKGTLLEPESETVYRIPIGKGFEVAAILTAETSVVMGTPRDIAKGAIVQLAGTLDQNRVLRAKQVVILTGYVRLLESAR